VGVTNFNSENGEEQEIKPGRLSQHESIHRNWENLLGANNETGHIVVGFMFNDR